MKTQTNALAEQIYQTIKQSIFNFEFIPGDRFTEQEIAARFNVSRTPVRDALYRLEREGYLQVAFRSGWNVRQFDFQRFGELYDLRIILEVAAVTQLCQSGEPDELLPLRAIWCIPASERLTDGPQVHMLDEAFHQSIIATARNREMAKVHWDVTEKIRIIRRLDFISERRIQTTYEEHQKILDLIRQRKTTEAAIALRAHIEASKAEVQKITLHMLHEARAKLAASTPPPPVDKPARKKKASTLAGAA